MTWTAPSKGGYSAKRGRKQGEPFPETPAEFTVPAPVSDTRREDVARALYEDEVAKWPGAPALDWMDLYRARREEYLGLADVALAVLPAPPVVDEASIRERIAQDIEDLPSRTVTGVPHDAAYIREHAARIARGATR